MKLLAAGCSLVYGSELADEQPHHNGYSHSTWTALLAHHWALDYHCCARPGHGNDAIARKIITALDDQTALVIVNWTYRDRFEFHFRDMAWQNISRLPGSGDETETTARLKNYQRAFYSELTEDYSMYNYLKEIILIQELLKNKKIPYIFSSADEPLHDKTRYVSISETHKKLYELIDFDHWFFWPEYHTFVKWANAQGFPLGPNLHPLEPAHITTFELYKNYIESRGIL